jgi:hypothetical protein
VERRVALLLEVARSPWLYLTAGPAVARAAFRVARSYGRCPFDELVGRLRQGRGAAPDVARARAQARVLGRLESLLPPRRMGRCLKRSLILLHLWSRAGLAPRCHIGFRPTADMAPGGHAWLSVDEPALADFCGSRGDHAEVLVL